MLFAVTLCLTSAFAQPDNSPIGDWLRNGKEGWTLISIEECKDKLCGSILKMELPQKDLLNDDQSMHDRDLEGISILSDLKTPNGRQWTGKLYDSEDGKNYTSVLSLKDPRTLKVASCRDGGFCKTELWTRTIKAPLIQSSPNNNKKS